jgi:hypothetical protein
MSFAGLRKLPKSPPGRARHCALVGGSMKKEPAAKPNRPLQRLAPLRGGCPGLPGHLSAAALAGRISPCSSVAALAWCPTVCRGTDDCGEHHPSTGAGRARTARLARHLGRLLSGAGEQPACAGGWALWVIGGSPDLSIATGGTYQLGTL